ncbi:MAG: IS1634 family transposase [Cyanobacteria bacterium P01_H01_bin.35]
MEEITVKNIDHLGIVAGLIDEIGIVEIINQKLGVDNREKITSGQAIKALILNGLGMVSSPLYLFSQFFEDKAVEKLLGTGIKSEYLNDDKIGRVMDEIYKLGLTNLFIEIGLLVIKKFNIETKYAHLDSTSFHLHGEYNQIESTENNQKKPILITKGYSRDHRPDLKQCVLDLIVSSDSGIPLFARAADGNESDKAVFGQILTEVKKQIKLDSIMVCDSALYSQENLRLISNLKWITRVPMTLKKAKEIIELNLEEVKIPSNTDPKIQEITRVLQEKGYKWLERKVTYAGVKQRWLIVESEPRKKSDIQKLESKIEQEKKTALKLVKKLETTGFDTVIQAQNYLKYINKKLKLWSVESLEIKEKVVNKQSIVYHYHIEIQPRLSEIERRNLVSGRFILATNIESSSEIQSPEILWNYKNQQSCERGFRFLKDPQFFADSFFVEKPQRVETILFVMSLCLLVYNLGQRELRNTLKRTSNHLKNQLGKLTNSPTLRWIFQCFQGVHFLTINQHQKVVNLTEERCLILQFLPSACQRYYQ